jgi:hypothetical protein
MRRVSCRSRRKLAGGPIFAALQASRRRRCWCDGPHGSASGRAKTTATPVLPAACLSNKAMPSSVSKTCLAPPPLAGPYADGACTAIGRGAALACGRGFNLWRALSAPLPLFVHPRPGTSMPYICRTCCFSSNDVAFKCLKVIGVPYRIRTGVAAVRGRETIGIRMRSACK